MDDIIVIKNLVKTYDTGHVQVKALKGINLSVKKGEYIAIMGQSGSGKSTFMNILGCLDRPTEGEYLLDGIDVMSETGDRLSFIRNKKIGFVFQSFNLIPRTSALKNVELPMIYSKVPHSQRKLRAIELLEKVGLGERIYHMPNEISGGQKQRIAIARALANNPPIILADEPTGALDQSTGQEVINILREINNQGKTVVLVTHDINIASNTNRIINICDGKIISDEMV